MCTWYGCVKQKSQWIYAVFALNSESRYGQMTTMDRFWGTMSIFQKRKNAREGRLNNNLLLLQVGSQQDRMHGASIFRFPNITLPCLLFPPLLVLAGNARMAAPPWDRRYIPISRQEQLQSVDRFPYFLPFHLALFYHCFYSWQKAMVEIGKNIFKMSKKLHRRELVQITRPSSPQLTQ